MTKFLTRESSYPIQEALLSRISWRAFSEERLTQEELMSLFEAARWAPSSYNNQPWRFLYARRGEPEWELFFSFLVDFNKKWVAKADTLVLCISRTLFLHNEKTCRTAEFDAGAAWMSLAVEAHARGLITHGMEGFDYEGARKALKIPDIYAINAMIAIGRPGNKDDLPEELKKIETPSDRRPLQEMIGKGAFAFTK